MNHRLLTASVFALAAPVCFGQVEWNELPLAPGIFFEGTAEFREGKYEILVPVGTGLEFKIAMNRDDMVVYAWTSDVGDPALLDVEFHGHTEPVDGKGDLMFYKIHNEGRESGTLKAPFSGIHGWYLNNRSGKDITVNLSVSGFFAETE
jgi:hypothetical protein